jgi:anaerobic selenocysteine-containing dehydrogenase
MNPADAKKKRLADGDEVTVTGDDLKLTWSVRLEKEQPAGTLFVVLPQGESLTANPLPVRLRKKNV